MPSAKVVTFRGDAYITFVMSKVETIQQRILRDYPELGEIRLTPVEGGYSAEVFPSQEEMKQRGILNITETLRSGPIARYNQTCPEDERILSCVFLPTGRNPRQHRPVPEPQTEEYRIIHHCLEQQFGIQNLHPEDNFELDLGMDSLDKVAFQSALHQIFGCPIPDVMLVHYPTPLLLARSLHECTKAIDGKAPPFSWSLFLRRPVEKRRLPFPSCLHYLTARLLSLLLHACFHYRYSGLENIPDGPCVIVANHQSFLDSTCITSVLSRKQLRETYFYAKSQNPDAPFLKFYCKRHNIVHVNVNKDLQLSIRKLATLLQQGKKVMIFPEGTRTFDGSLSAFKRTFALLAKEFRAPIVPIAIDGAFRALPRTRTLPVFQTKITMTILPPIPVAEEDTVETLVQKTVDALRTVLG